MERIIKEVKKEDYLRTEEFVQEVFTESENETEGKLVRSLVKEIRSKKYYEPRLDIMMVDENDEVIGYLLFSKFTLQDKYYNELLLLSPVAVKTKYQRQHISKELIEHGFNRAKMLGYKAVIVEGNPLNYRARGFKTSSDYNIFADESVHLPSKECLMVYEIEKGYLLNVSGYVKYDYYDTLK